MAQVYVSLGSNIEPLSHIQAGLTEMQPHFGTFTLSSVYESEAIGFEGANFYNLVAKLQTDMEIHAIARILRQIEANNGRKRTANRFSARTLDLDIILYDDLIFKDNEVEVPRTEILKYAFVLLPLAEIAPDTKHPITHQTYAEIWQQFDKKEQHLWKIDF